jgi:deoxycytidylate deaminase
MPDSDGEGVVLGDPLELARTALGELVHREPERHPLVIALVAPLGVPLDPIIGHLEQSFARYDYETRAIHLSHLLDDLPIQLLGPLPKRDEKGYYASRMNAGDQLRADAGTGAALAALAIGRLSQLRDEAGVENVAFILRSLKHPEEEALLRHIYGDSFSLIGISSTVDERREALADVLALFADPKAEAERLMARDESDAAASDYGQNVRQVFTLADAYIPIVRGIDTRPEVERFVDSLFGAPFLTPRFEEEAMKLAHTASLRSAALGRQVGVALVPEIGTPIVVGTNEVPKPGGGQYWADDSPDHRDFQTGSDPNPVYTKRVVQEVLERLAEHEWLIEDLRKLSGPELMERANTVSSGRDSVLEGARASALIEFTRCLHAEQAAIINAARCGVATQGSVLFTTTFPCHECTKMIIGAGVVEVNYIEPYPKSLANRLFRDLIDTEPTARADPGLVNRRVPFRAFQGIAPRRYDTAFVAGQRRVGDSAAVVNRNASPRTGGWLKSVVERAEDSALTAIGTILQGLVNGSGKTAPGTDAVGQEASRSANPGDAEGDPPIEAGQVS